MGGKIVGLEEHLDRLRHGATQVGIDWPPRDREENPMDVGSLCHSIVDANQAVVRRRERRRIVVLLSPGDPGITGGQQQPLVPTLKFILLYYRLRSFKKVFRRRGPGDSGD